MSADEHLARQRTAGLVSEERGLRSATRPPRRAIRAGGRFRENKLAVAGLIVIVLFYAIAIAAPLISRYDPTIQSGLALQAALRRALAGHRPQRRAMSTRGLIVGARRSRWRPASPRS